MCTLVEELSNCYDSFWVLSGFPDLLGKVFLITLKLSLFDFSTTSTTAMQINQFNYFLYNAETL